MRVAFRFRVDVDPDRFRVWDGCEPGQVRRRLVWELAADLTESPAVAETGARVVFAYTGGQDIPAVTGGRTLREQIAHDEDGKWA